MKKIVARDFIHVTLNNKLVVFSSNLLHVFYFHFEKDIFCFCKVLIFKYLNLKIFLFYNPKKNNQL